MTPIKTPQTTSVLDQPENWDEETHGPCVGLPVAQSEGVFYSYWKPSLRDKVRLLFGGHVRMCLLGDGHPPVMIDTEA